MTIELDTLALILGDLFKGYKHHGDEIAAVVTLDVVYAVKKELRSRGENPSDFAEAFEAYSV